MLSGLGLGDKKEAKELTEDEQKQKDKKDHDSMLEDLTQRQVIAKFFEEYGDGSTPPKMSIVKFKEMMKKWFPDAQDKKFHDNKDALEEIFCMFFEEMLPPSEIDDMSTHVLTTKNNFLEGIFMQDPE